MKLSPEIRQSLLASIEGYKAELTERDRDFVPAMEVWINKGRYAAFMASDKSEAPAETLEQIKARYEAEKVALWTERVSRFREGGHWNDLRWGWKPSEEGCQAPDDILIKFGFKAGGGNA